MKIPSNVLGFEVNTSSWHKDKSRWNGARGHQTHLFPQYYNKKKEAHWTQELSTVPKHEPSQDELDWLASTQYEGNETEAGSAEWLAEQLGDDCFCAWCGNHLVLEFSGLRQGYSVSCTYCGARGPSESEREEALAGYLSFTRIDNE